MMICYYKGLPANQTWLRVDVERHFEALPRHEIKDLVATKRPVHNAKALNFVQTASHNTNLHSHSGRTGELYQAHV